MSDDEIENFLGTMNEYNDGEFDFNFFNDLNKKGNIAMCGGLWVEKEEKVIQAQCCADFADWKDYEKCINNNESPWLGHSPDPWFEYKGDDIIIWNDAKDAKENFQIKVSKVEMLAAIGEIEKTLENLVLEIKEWANRKNFEYKKKFLESIKNYLL